MPLFKVRSTTGLKVVIIAPNLGELKVAAKAKLQLASDPATFKVFDESDGSMIEDDDSLSALWSFANSNGQHLQLAILENGQQFGNAPTINIIESPVEARSPSTPVQNVDDIIPTVLPTLPYKDIAHQLRQAVKSPSHVRNQALLRARRNIVKTLTDKLKTKTLPPGTLKKVCTKIHGSCPEAFSIALKENVSVNCLPQFSRSLYNALGYAKDVEGIQKRQKSTRSSQHVENSEELLHFRVDTNGCADGMWAPHLSEDDLDQSELARKELVALAELPSGQLDPLTHRLMKSTYAFQRHVINSTRTNAQWAALVEKWPVFESEALLLTHANLLLGKELCAVWEGEFSASDFIFQYFSEYAEAASSRKGLRMKECLNSAIEAAESGSSTLPKKLAVIPLAALFLGDEIKELFIIVRDPLTCPEDARREANCVSKCPIVVVNGFSIFDAQATCFVVFRNVVIRTTSALQGALLAVCSYFVFNIQFPKRAHSTLEFLQRYFLLINPAGSKTSAKVASLAAGLNDYEARCSRWV